ncbi:GNAT family N-acetyltransferase [Planococcus salinarum]|uniref:GNAT family N-acetyltransferase n=1 Tax=Planococcus salinarum TaxID=622695 RepID=UPI000E3CC1CB|nr:GNAT family N-acetyltransferase [Planococcus salinarum]TAA72281.1 GNAT family N-acetyltransferase [Planococcus salinarum]
MEIRIISPQDAEAYYILRLEALLDSPDAFSTLYEDALNKPIDKTRANLASEDAVTFGAYEGGRLVGNMTLARKTLPKMKHRASIVAVYVSPQFRGTGLANALMDKVMDYADGWDGLERLDLMVASDNLRAKNFYLKYGFETYGTEIHSMKTGEIYIDEDLMVKFIK